MVHVFPDGSHQFVVELRRLSRDAEMAGLEALEIGGIANEEVVTVQQIRLQFGCRTLLDGAEHEVGAGGVDVNAEDAA